MIALVAAATLAVVALATWGCWRLCVAGVDAGDHPGDAISSLHREDDGRTRVLVDAGPGHPVVVGIRVTPPRVRAHSALVGPLVVRVRRRPVRDQPLVGVVEPLGTGQWWVEARPTDRVVVTIGQPDGRLVERDHAVPALQPPRRLAV